MNALDPTVFIVEDDLAIAEAIAWLLKTVDLNVELFSNGKSYLETHDPTRIGCLIVDVRMPEMSGLELQERLNQKKNTLPLIFITGHGDIAMAVRALQAGALNFIVKPFNDQVLLDEVQKAIALSRKPTAKNNIANMENYKSLSEREKEILRLIVDGKLNKQIAQELEIANSTVELHRSQLMKKMKADSLAHLIKIYLTLEHNNILESS